MSDAVYIKTFAAVCPYCGRTWHPQSDGYNEHSYCDECEPERIQAALKARAEKGRTFRDVGDYILPVPTQEEVELATRTIEELFKPQLRLFPADESL